MSCDIEKMYREYYDETQKDNFSENSEKSQLNEYEVNLIFFDRCKNEDYKEKQIFFAESFEKLKCKVLDYLSLEFGENDLFGAVDDIKIL